MAFSRDLCIGMSVQRKQPSALIAIACFQFIFDGHHFIEQPIEFCVLASEKCLVLFDVDGGEALEELRHCHLLEFDPLHGSRNGKPAPLARLEDTSIESVNRHPRVAGLRVFARLGHDLQHASRALGCHR
jgi:hypothetical protein